MTTDNLRSIHRTRLAGYFAVALVVISLSLAGVSYAQALPQEEPAERGKQPFFSRSFVENLRRQRTITGGVQLSVVAGGPQTILVDPSWSFTEINNLMDGNPLTLGKNGTPDPASYSGDTVLFAAGTYQTPPINTARFRNNISGIVIQGEEETFLQNDPQLCCGVVFTNNGIDIIITGITIRNSSFGIANISPDLSPTSPVFIVRNRFTNVWGQTTAWNNVTVAGDNSTPSIIEDSNTYQDIFLGAIHNNSGPATSEQTAFAMFSNNTGVNVGALWYEPVRYFANEQSIYLGLSLTDGNVMIDSDGVFLPEGAYSSGGLAASSNSNIAGVDMPDANLEHDVALNPNGSYPYGGSLQSTVGGLNIVADPVLSIHRRPLPGSPLIGDGRCKTLDGGERHYCGSNAPAGDYDVNGVVSGSDQTEFWRVINLNNVGLTPHELATFDFTDDNLVNHDDVGYFYQAFHGPNPAIPAASTWGLLTMTIAIAIGATWLLRRPALFFPLEGSGGPRAASPDVGP